MCQPTSQVRSLGDQGDRLIVIGRLERLLVGGAKLLVVCRNISLPANVEDLALTAGPWEEVALEVVLVDLALEGGHADRVLSEVTVVLFAGME